MKDLDKLDYQDGEHDGWHMGHDDAIEEVLKHLQNEEKKYASNNELLSFIKELIEKIENGELESPDEDGEVIF